MTFALFTRDPGASYDFHPITGIVSNIGILFWCSTAAICLFCSAMLYKNGNIKRRKFLMFSGLLTLMLLLDDFFMLHEFIIPRYFHISEKVTYVIYMVLVLVYLYKFYELIKKTEYPFLLLALGFFALSVLSDVFLLQRGWEYLAEDGFKLLGIASWSLFYMRTSFKQLQNDIKIRYQE